ncbi:MAG: class I SAM-dependent methyltransferase [Candidatus Lokiarchaeota archaeon]|nr:class I SAM-dependent methyltransferase [Candidatus Lokiarchaeota archaeon]
MSHKRSPKVPTRDSFVSEGAQAYQGARWMERIQHATTRRALALMGDDRIGGEISNHAMAAGIVIDVGCGNGFSTETILEHGFTTVVGVELSEDMLALRHLPNPVVQADMARLPFRDGMISFVISISAMNFLSQDVEDELLVRKIYETFARQVHSLLEPGGRGVVEFYPKSPGELDAITRAFGSRSGFHGFLVIDKPGTRKEQKFLIFKK